MDLTDKNTLVRLLKKYNLWARKAFGQNFLTDSEVIEDLIKAADLSREDTVIEIGPGVGAITRELLQRASRVIAVEKDERAVPILKETTSEFSNLEIVVSLLPSLRRGAVHVVAQATSP